jgi:heat shock protein HslJ
MQEYHYRSLIPMKFPYTLTLFALLFAVPLLSACSAVQGLSGSSWQLVELNGQKLPDGVIITLAFDDDTLEGSGGCNSYSATYERSDSNLTISDITSTLMYCEDSSAFETEYFNALKSLGSFELAENQLTLSGDQGAIKLVFAPATNP